MKNKSSVVVALVIISLSFYSYNYLKKDSDNMKKDSTVYNENEGVLKEKLNKLNNINEKIDFFLMDNLDRYISYKDNNPSLTDEMIIVMVNIGLDKDFYSNVKNASKVNDKLILVNKYNYLPNGYEPDDLEFIDLEYGIVETKLRKEAKNAFIAMAKNAKKEGYPVIGVSGYRSYQKQENIYNSYLIIDPKDIVDTYSARPGYSEHQTGLAIDVSDGIKSYNEFSSTDSYNWMKNNSYKYGFILRYTKKNTNITGYKYEPWHYRYVGVDVATYIYNNNITFDEYYVRFLQK